MFYVDIPVEAQRDSWVGAKTTQLVAIFGQPKKVLLMIQSGAP